MKTINSIDWPHQWSLWLGLGFLTVVLMVKFFNASWIRQYFFWLLLVFSLPVIFFMMWQTKTSLRMLGMTSGSSRLSDRVCDISSRQSVLSRYCIFSYTYQEIVRQIPQGAKVYLNTSGYANVFMTYHLVDYYDLFSLEQADYSILDLAALDNKFFVNDDGRLAFKDSHGDLVELGFFDLIYENTDSNLQILKRQNL